MTLFSNDDPITRLRNYLTNQGAWDDTKEEQLITVRSAAHLICVCDTILSGQGARAEILMHFKEAEKQLKPRISELFEDVFDELTPALKEQVCARPCEGLCSLLSDAFLH